MDNDAIKRIGKMKESRGFTFTAEEIAGLKALSLCARPNDVDFFPVTEDSIDYLKTKTASLKAGELHPMNDFEIMGLVSILIGCWFSSETHDNMSCTEYEVVDNLREKLSAIMKSRRNEFIH